ncbi:MAG: hypothetical protein OEV44_07375, partial [Spirochaetota bacterium]|nr:hypothetical protein [Spirochaetota bacterium]
YINPKNDFPLTKFTHRYDNVSSTIGYGKSMMVFHQLKMIIGDDLFFKALKSLYESYKFKFLNWENIEKHFEKQYHKDLSWFFNQWVYKTGAPELLLKDVNLTKEKNKSYNLRFTLAQNNITYRLLIPISIVIKGNKVIKKVISLSEKEKQYVINLKHRPINLHIDPNYDIFRKLNPNEIPPSLSNIFSDTNKKNHYTPTINPELHAILSVILNAKSIVVKKNKLITSIFDFPQKEKLIDKNTIIIPSTQKTVIISGNLKTNHLFHYLKLPKEITISENSFSVNNKKYKGHNYLLVAVIKGQKPNKHILMLYSQKQRVPNAVLNKIIHYQNYSYLVFKDTQVIDKGEFPVDNNPMIFNFSKN